MYKRKTNPNKTSIKINQSEEGERLEEKIKRITQNKEPIKDGAELIYSDRSEGVNPATDIRTDKWEIAAQSMDKVHQMRFADRDKKNNPEPKTPETGTSTGPDTSAGATQDQ